MLSLPKLTLPKMYSVARDRKEGMGQWVGRRESMCLLNFMDGFPPSWEWQGIFVYIFKDYTLPLVVVYAVGL